MMPYLSSLKLYYKFDNTLLTNEVDGGTLSPSVSPTIVPAVNNSGLHLEQTFYASTTTSLGITTAFSAGFWLNSVHPGVATTGSAVVPLKMPLIAKADFSNYHIAIAPQFAIWEEAMLDGNNTLVVYLNSGSGTVTIRSAEYAPATFNHFVVSYGTSLCHIYINGIAVTVSISGSIPSSLVSTSDAFTVNKGAVGNSYEVVKNTGILDDLFVANTVLTASDVHRIYSLGVPYVYDSTLLNIQEIDQQITFIDPTTIQVNSVLSDNSDVYVGKSDGTLMKGHRDFWQVRRHFGSQAEQSLLSEIYGSPGTTYTVSEGAITINTLLVNL